MRVYLDIFSKDEIVSDSYSQVTPLEKEDLRGVAFEIVGKRVQTGGEDFGISSNVDEDAEAGTTGEGGADTNTVIDLVDRFKLQESPFGKKDFGAYIKGYMANVKNHLAATSPDRVDTFVAGATALIKHILSTFDEWTFYFGENAFDHFDECKALPIFAYYKEGEEVPRLIYLSDGLKEEKY